MATPTLDNNSTFVHFAFSDDGQRMFMELPEVPLLHACYESNTFIIDHTQLEEDRYNEIRSDLIDIDGMPVPYGQFAIFVYTGEGEFFLWSSSENANTGKMAVAFQSFGYEPSIDSPVRFYVSERDLFKLKLQFGS